MYIDYRCKCNDVKCHDVKCHENHQICILVVLEPFIACCKEHTILPKSKYYSNYKYTHFLRNELYLLFYEFVVANNTILK